MRLTLLQYSYQRGECKLKKGTWKCVVNRELPRVQFLSICPQNCLVVCQFHLPVFEDRAVLESWKILHLHSGLKLVKIFFSVAYDQSHLNRVIERKHFGWLLDYQLIDYQLHQHPTLVQNQKTKPCVSDISCLIITFEITGN